MAKRNTRFLEIGKRYMGPFGWFEVTEKFKDKEIKVKVKLEVSGDVREYHEDLLAGAVFKNFKNDMITQPYKNPDINASYTKTLGYLAKSAFIMADIPYTSRDNFNKNYFEIKNRDVNQESEGYCIHRCGDTWTYAIRVMFKLPEELTIDDFKFSPSAEAPKNVDSETLRISDNNWGWDLLNIGFNIGSKHNVGEIKNNIPKEYIKYFEEGYSL